jgi:hypothetical protein
LPSSFPPIALLLLSRRSQSRIMRLLVSARSHGAEGPAARYDLDLSSIRAGPIFGRVFAYAARVTRKLRLAGSMSAGSGRCV